MDPQRDCSADKTEKCPDQLIEFGEEQFAQGNYGAAKDSFLSALELDSQQCRAHNNLGCLYYLQGDFSLAEQHLEMARELSPEWLQPLENLAEVYKADKNPYAELSARQQILDMTKETPGALNALALCWLELGDLDEVLVAFRRSLELDGSQQNIREILEEIEPLKRSLDPESWSVETESAGFQIPDLELGENLG